MNKQQFERQEYIGERNGYAKVAQDSQDTIDKYVLILSTIMSMVCWLFDMTALSLWFFLVVCLDLYSMYLSIVLNRDTLNILDTIHRKKSTNKLITKTAKTGKLLEKINDLYLFAFIIFSILFFVL